MKNKKLLIVGALLFILVLAVFFRFWQLDNIPPGLYPDVAINGNDALDTLATKNFKLFYPENNGREGLFMWLIVFSFILFGPSVWAMKIVAAIIGTLTILGLYLLTKELLKIAKHKSPELIALLSAFFLAISFWHVNFSRIGFRVIMIPFLLVFAFYCLFRGFNQKKIIWLIVSGIFLGLGFYTYISYRFIVFAIATSLLTWWLVYRKNRLQKKFFLSSLYLVLAIFIVSLPIGIYFLAHPADFLGRAAGVSIFKQANPPLELGKSIVLHLGMFNIHGDANWRHNLANAPMLIWPVGILFIVGIIFALKELIVSKKQKDGARFSVYVLIFSWFFFMMLASLLSSEGAPHALRTLGVIPIVCLFAGLGGWWIFGRIKPFFQTRNQIIVLYVCISLFLATVAFAEFNKYFYQWARNPNISGAFSEDYVAIGNYVNSLPSDAKIYVIVNQDGVRVPFPNGLPMPTQTPIFLERAKFQRVRAIYLLPIDLDKIQIAQNTTIVPLQYDQGLFDFLSVLLPGGQIIKTGNVWAYTF